MLISVLVSKNPTRIRFWFSGTSSRIQTEFCLEKLDLDLDSWFHLCFDLELERILLQFYLFFNNQRLADG